MHGIVWVMKRQRFPCRRVALFPQADNFSQSSPVCVGHGRKPRKHVSYISWRDSQDDVLPK